MTLRTRNRLVDLFLFLFATTLAYLIYELFRSGSRVENLSQHDFFTILIRSVVPLTLGFIGLLGFYRYFRKVTGSLIFFFFISLFSLVFDSAGILVLLLRAQDLSFDGIVLLSRANLFGLTLGTLAMATASMYVAGLSYQNQGTALSIVFILSYILAQEIPLATSLPTLAGLFPPIPSLQLTVLWSIAGLIIFLNFLRSAYGNQNKDEAILGVAVILYLGGRLLLNIADSLPTVFLSSALLIGGAGYYGKKVFEYYLWY